MNNITVHILTTDGPVAIQRIIEEDPVVNSVICLDGRAQALPISPAYDAFVRSPIGIIEKMTGHPAYRMDVSARVDEGRSWQLAACIAHAAALQKSAWQGRIYATGEVDTDLAVRAVEQIPMKLTRLNDVLGSEANEPGKAMILVPVSDDPIPDNIQGIPIYAVGTVNEALAKAGLAWPVTAARSAAEKNKKQETKLSSKRGLAIVLSAALFAALVFGVGVDVARWTALLEQGRIQELEKDLNAADQGPLGELRADLYQQWRAMKQPQPQDIDIRGYLFSAADAGACGDSLKQVKSPLEPQYNGTDVVCAVEFRALAKEAGKNIVGRLAFWPSGLGAEARADRVMRGSKEISGRTWTLSFDRPPQNGAALRLIVIAGDVEIRGSQPWYQELLSAPLDSVSFKAAARRLETLGFTIIANDWRRD